MPVESGRTKVALRNLAGIEEGPLHTLASELRVGIGILWPNGEPYPGFAQFGFSKFCEYVRRSSYGSNLCRESDRNRISVYSEQMENLDRLAGRGDCDAELQAELQHWFRCPFGLLDLCYPIFCNKEPVAFLFMGQLRDRDVNTATVTSLLEAYERLKRDAQFKVPLADFLSAYFAIPRRNLGAETTIHVYRVLRELAGLFSGILQDRHTLDQAIELANTSTPLGETSSVLKQILEKAPLEEGDIIDVWLVDSVSEEVFHHRLQLQGPLKDPQVLRPVPVLSLRYCQLDVPSTSLSVDAKCYAPDWLAEYVARGQEAEASRSSPLPLTDYPQVPWQPQCFLCNTLAVKGAILGYLTVLGVTEDGEQRIRLQRWMETTTPLMASLVHRQIQHNFLKVVYSCRNPRVLGQAVERSVMHLPDLQDSICTVFWVERYGEKPGDMGERLLPTDPTSVERGPGATVEGGLWYALGEGLTGWVWENGAFLAAEKKALQFTLNKDRRSALSEATESLFGSGGAWPENLKQPVQVSKIAAKLEKDVLAVKTWVGVPIVDGDRVLGVIRIVTKEEGAFLDTSTVALLYQMASHMATVKTLSESIELESPFESMLYNIHEVEKDLRHFVSSVPEAGTAELKNLADWLRERVNVVHQWLCAVNAVGLVVTERLALRADDTVQGRLTNARLDYCSVDLRAVCGEVCGTMLKQYPTDRYEISFKHAPPDESEASALVVKGSPGTIATIVTELLRNAIRNKLDEKGCVAVRHDITITYDKREDKEIIVRIRDEAQPFSRPILAAISDLRKKPSTVKPPTRGLGLEMCCINMLLHGGYLEVDQSSIISTKEVRLHFPITDQILLEDTHS